MKICFIAHRIDHPISGGELYNDALLDSAKLAGFRVEKWQGVHRDKSNIILRILLMNFEFFFKTLLLSKKDLLIFDTDFHARFIIALLWAKYVKKIKTIGIVHHYCFLVDKGRIANTIHYLLEKFVTNKFDYMILNSHFSHNIFSSLIKKPIPFTILNPFSITGKTVSVQKAYYNSDKVNLLHVGTLEERKNILNALKAASSLNINYSWHFIGHCYSSDYLDKIHELITQYHLKEKVFFHGRVDIDLLSKFYSDSMIFVLVSRLEGYGMVYAEAMHYGLPIVGSIMGAVPELVQNGENGFLCDPENPHQIAEAIIKLTDKDTWQRIHHNNLLKASSLMDRESFIQHGKTLFEKILL
jgi:glycosyltransferase involved in cell wall biosynthesis